MPRLNFIKKGGCYEACKNGGVDACHDKFDGCPFRCQLSGAGRIRLADNPCDDACRGVLFHSVWLVSAELAAAWPYDGGMYLWVREAFGPEWGFVTVCMQWLNSLPWFATVLTFIATSLAYMFEPALAQDRLFVYLVLVTAMWGCTVINFRGIRMYERITSTGVIVGTVFPSIVIIVLAVIYLGAGHAPQIEPSAAAFVPQIHNLNDFMLFAGMMVSLAGIDMPAIHVTDVKNPKKNFPKSILISATMILGFTILGSLGISLVVSPEKLSMAYGAPEAFSIMFESFSIGFLTPVMCVILIIGALTTVITWTLGPSKGLLEVAKEGYLPAFWQKRNKYDIPVPILCLQAAIPCVIGLVIFIMPTIGSAFWVMIALSSQLYMLMYVMMFLAVIRLRYSKADTVRPYKIPGGKTGLYTVCGFGIITSLSSMACGFIPPSSVREKGVWHIIGYMGFIASGTVFFVVMATVLIKRRIRKKREAAGS